MRRNITGILALAGALLLVTTWAVAEYSLRPPLTHRHDDGVISLGNTQATPDVAIQWETADASDHHLAIDALSTSDLVVSWDQGTDWASRTRTGLGCSPPMRRHPRNGRACLTMGLEASWRRGRQTSP